MNKEEKTLLEAKLYLSYYKKDITDRYDAILDRLVLDNDILNSYEYLWVTPISKHQKLQQENKQLKEKYLNAVRDYEQEKSKNNKAIEEINNNCILLPTEYADKVGIFKKKLRKILEGDNNE